MKAETYTCKDCLFYESDDKSGKVSCWASRRHMCWYRGKPLRICRHFRLTEMYTKPNPIGFAAMQTLIAKTQQQTRVTN